MSKNSPEETFPKRNFPFKASSVPDIWISVLMNRRFFQAKDLLTSKRQEVFSSTAFVFESGQEQMSVDHHNNTYFSLKRLLGKSLLPLYLVLLLVFFFFLSCEGS